MAGTGKLNKFAYWANDDVNFYPGMEKFGVHLSKLDCPVESKLRVICCIEDQ